MCWKTHESTFHGHENILVFRFHGVNTSHDISTKFLADYFHAWTMKSLQSHEYGFSRVMKVTSILDWYILWPLKSNSDSDSLACISCIVKIVMAHENVLTDKRIIKKPWNAKLTSTKVDDNVIEWCCTQYSIYSSSCQICLYLGQLDVRDDTHWSKNSIKSITSLVQRNCFIDFCY